MTFDFTQADAVAIAGAVRSGQVNARAVATAALDRISARDLELNCFTTILSDQALATADQIDLQIAQGQDPGPLAGVPFAVKNLLDIQGITTLAGSKINQEDPPATEDATSITRLKQAGAILVGALNMDEYAYGFVTENTHYGPVHNPHDLTRIAGGSSGGSAASVAAGLVPLTLGSDTNGSIRVPAALCGVFGLKPTYGRLSRAGCVLFAFSFDHVGPLARSVRDIATAFDTMQGPDPRDPICTDRPPELCLPQLQRGIEGLRMGVLSDHFAQGMQPEVRAGVDRVIKALGVEREVILPEARRARAAAYVITASEGASEHLDNLRTRPQDFDPTTRDRFLAGALLPSQWVLQAQRFRSWYREQMRQIWQTVDLLIAPTTPCAAPLIGQTTMMIDGEEVLTRPNLGLYTQPLSFIGLPVLSVPIQQPGGLPVGVQLIGAPYQEAAILRAGAVLAAQGLVKAAIV